MAVFPIEETIRARRSVRTFDPRPVPEAVREEILAYAAEIRNPLGPGPRLQFIDKAAAENGEKLGTYGVIRGAGLFLGAAIGGEETAREALGWELEELVLYMTARGLGTCWLGGTFHKSAFARAMGPGPEERIPIITPVGYAARKKSLVERMMRSGIKADGRRPWEELFFDGQFGVPLSRESAGDAAFPLDMLRLAPSAANGQPWRVVKRGEDFHFYEIASMGGEAGGADMQRIDLGIGLCHFALAAGERGLPGRIVRQAPAELEAPEKAVYIASWMAE